MSDQVTQKVINEIIAMDKTAPAFRSLSSKFGKADKQASSLGKSMAGAFSVAGGMVLAAGISAVGTALRRSVQDALDFNRAMAEVSTLVDTNIVNMEKMQKQVRSMGIQFGKSGTEISKGYYQAISASIADSDIEEFMTKANKLAVAGVSTTAQSVDLLTNVINAYGAEVSETDKISAELMHTVAQGKTTMGELASSLGKIMPIAKQAGVARQEIFAMTAALTKQGISTSETMTLQKGILQAVIKPAGEVAKYLEKMQKQGKLLNFSMQGIKKVGIVGLFKDLKEATEGNLSEMAKVIPAMEGMAGAAALTGANFKGFVEILKSMNAATKDHIVAYGKMSSSMAFKTTILTNGFNEASTAFTEGLIGGFSDGVGSTNSLQESMKELVKTTKELGKAAGIATAAMGRLFSYNLTQTQRDQSEAQRLETIIKRLSGKDSKLASDAAKARAAVNAQKGGDAAKGIAFSGFIMGEKEEEINKKIAVQNKKSADALKGRAVNIAWLLRVSDDLLAKDKKAQEIKKAIDAEKKASISLEEQKTTDINNKVVSFLDYAKKKSEEHTKEFDKQLEVQKKITEEKDKQRNGMANELNLMSEIGREQAKQLAEYLAGATKEQLLNLNDPSKERLRGSQYLKDIYKKRSEATGLTDDTSERMAELQGRAMGKGWGEGVSEALKVKAVNSLEENAAIAEADEKMAGAA